MSHSGINVIHRRSRELHPGSRKHDVSSRLSVALPLLFELPDLPVALPWEEVASAFNRGRPFALALEVFDDEMVLGVFRWPRGVGLHRDLLGRLGDRTLRLLLLAGGSRGFADLGFRHGTKDLDAFLRNSNPSGASRGKDRGEFEV